MMNRIIILFNFILLVIFVNIAESADITLSASVDRRVVTIEDEINLAVEINGADSVSIQNLNLPQGVIEGGRSTSRNIQIINGKMSSNLTYNFTLVPQNIGKFKIGPIKVQHNGRTYESNSIDIEIAGGNTNEVQSKGEGEFYLRQWVDKTNSFVNEKIVYTVEFGRRVDVADASFSSFPEFSEFLVEEIQKGAQETKIINGTKYFIYKIQKALFPTKSGSYAIESPVLSFYTYERNSRSRSLFDDFGFGSLMGQRKKRVLKAQPVNLSVTALPEDGKPLSFTGIVGKFDIKAELSDLAVKRGDSLTMSIDIFGEGNIKGIKTPILPTLPDFKVYDDKPVTEEKVIGDRIVGKQSFKKALIPLSEGEFSIPPISMSYFDPILKKYIVKETESKKITVLPGDSESLNSVTVSPFGSEKKEVEVVGKDILPIQNKIKSFNKDSTLPFYFMIFLLIPPFGFLGLFYYRKKMIVISQDINYENRKRAYKNALVQINKTEKCKDAEFYAEGARVLKTFIGNKLGISGTALTPLDIRTKLCTNGVDESIANKISSFLEDCEYKIYCGKDGCKEEKKELIKKLSIYVKELNKVIR